MNLLPHSSQKIKTISLKSIILTFFLLVTNLSSQPQDVITFAVDFTKMVDFSPGYHYSGRVSGFSNIFTLDEIRGWAANNGLSISGDHSIGGRQNNLCAFVEYTGAKIKLIAQTNKNKLMSSVEEQKLWFDFVMFKSVDPEKNKTGYQKLRIYVNGHLMKTLSFGYNVLFDNPLKIVIDPTIIPDGEINIELRPSLGTSVLWALWDIGLQHEYNAKGEME
jgi:hypothetical protein